jgi:S1-C subfamily serine protease
MNSSASHLLTGRKAAWTAGVLAVAGVLVGLRAAQDSNPTVTLKRETQPVASDRIEGASFSDVVKRVSPSVVKITTRIAAHEAAAGENAFRGFDPPTFRDFFGGRGAPEMRQAPQGGLGSGVIISADGYIATNNHVVDGADTVTVTLTDGRDFIAKLVGRDQQTDIAVIKVDANALPAVTFADTSKMRSVTACLRSAIRSASAKPSRAASSAPRAATSESSPTSRAMKTSSRPTPRLIPATPAARSSTSTASSLASTPRFSAATAASRA